MAVGPRSADGRAQQLERDLTHPLAHLVQYQLGAGNTNAWAGGNGGWYAFKGLIDEPTFYNRALPLEEVRSLFNVGSVGKLASVAVTNAATLRMGVACDKRLCTGELAI